MVLGLAVMLSSGCAALRGGSVSVVRGGRTAAVIVTAAVPSETAAEAAVILRDVITQMTGQTLVIVPETEAPDKGTLLVVGPSRLSQAMGIDVPQDRQAGDQYVIRRQGRSVALVGNDDGELQGTIYAVYDLLQRLGCGWFGPDPAWHVIPEVDDLRIPDLDVSERPAFQMRHIWRVSRNQPHGRAWRMGGQRIHSGGHVLNRLVSRELIEQHPDWWPMEPKGAGQPDICHPEVIEHVANQFKEQLAADDEFHSFAVGANDTHLWPDSLYTRAIGNPGAQSLYFANQIADRLRPDFEGRFALSFYAYWVTHEPPPPEMKAAPEVFVFYVNESNKAKPWDEPEPPEMDDFLKSQEWTRRHFQGWVDTGAQMGIYDWWIPGFIYQEWRDLPWIALETTTRNLSYWHEHGVRHVTKEADYERTRWPLIRWPLYYIGARALWNPAIDADVELRKACDLLFGPAAADMFGYYKVLERAMFETPYFQQNWNMPPPEKVYTPDIVDAATAHMDAAAALADGDDAIMTRITQERALWDKAVETINAAREEPRVFYRTYVDGKFMFWHQPETTVGTIRSLFGIPNHIPLYIVMPDGEVQETDTTALEARYGEVIDEKLDTTVTISLEDGVRLVTERPEE